MPTVRRTLALASILAALSMPSCMCTRPSNERTVEPAIALLRAVDVPARARGMWVWGTKKRLADPRATTSLLETCRAVRLTEVYLSVNEGVLEDPRLPALVSALDSAGLRVEALMGEAVWYRPEMRARMLALIDGVVAFNERSRARFAAVHLDIEPHQLPENKKNHAFLPALAETLREARARAEGHGMATSADLPRFAVEAEGPLFARAVDRVFLMLYQLRDRGSPWLVSASRAVIDQTYAGLAPVVEGRLVVGLRVEDYPEDIDAMTKALDVAHRGHDRYGGWAVHDEAKYRARFTGGETVMVPAKTSCP